MYVDYLKLDISLDTKKRLCEFISTIIDTILFHFTSLIKEFLLNTKAYVLNSFHIFCLNLLSHEICQFKKCFENLIIVYLKDIFYDTVNFKMEYNKQNEKIIFNYFASNWLKESVFSENLQLDNEINFYESLNLILKNKVYKLQKTCYIISEILQIVNH